MPAEESCLEFVKNINETDEEWLFDRFDYKKKYKVIYFIECYIIWCYVMLAILGTISRTITKTILRTMIRTIITRGNKYEDNNRKGYRFE